MSIYDLAAHQNRINTALDLIESADAHELITLLNGIYDRLDEADNLALDKTLVALSETIERLTAFDRDPRHPNGCDCAECCMARMDTAFSTFSDNLDRMFR